MDTDKMRERILDLPLVSMLYCGRGSMSHTISIEEAATQLSGLVRALGPDDEIVLTENDKPIARIVPNSGSPKRVAGAWKGLLTIVHEDDEHLDDFKEYMP